MSYEMNEQIAIETFRAQHPEYADSDLQVECGSNEERKFTIRPVTDPSFSVSYYALKKLEEEGDNEQL